MTKTQIDFLTFSTLMSLYFEIIVLVLLGGNLCHSWLTGCINKEGRSLGFSLKRLKLSQHFTTKLLRENIFKICLS